MFMLLLKRVFTKTPPFVHLKMSVFTQKLNPITGKSDWEMQNEDYDYHQEVARSSFADMLHDTERNQKYEQALKLAIAKLHSDGKRANVLDIGTGTGLLAMMAVRHGADSVTACEAFKPMSKCAVRIIKLNGYEGKINVVPKRSTDLVVGAGGDLVERANILVTEVFDTELIGEGALSTFSHAHKELLEADCVVIPQSATIYAQVVECPLVQNWNKLKDIYSSDGDVLVKVPDSVKKCPGAIAVHDLQLSQLPTELINTIVSPKAVLRFDWSGKTPFVFERSTILTVEAERRGVAQAIFMWWELVMDLDGRIVLSCAPIWAHPNAHSKIPWRDHWMQAVYYLPKQINLTRGEEVNLISCHDEFSLWFNLRKDLKVSDDDYMAPICECGLHVAYSRTRIGQMNDCKRGKKLLAVLEENVNSESVVLILSHGCFVGLSAVKLGAKKVYTLEHNLLARRILADFIRFNELENVHVIENVDELGKMEELREVNFVFTEPYYTSTILPWDNLLFTYLLDEVGHLLREDVKILPHKAVVYGLPMEFTNLQKIRASLGSCEGFLMKDFDELIEKSRTVSDSNVEAQPLWEYPGTALSEPVQIASVDFRRRYQNVSCNGVFELKRIGNCNGIALWVDWEFGDSPANFITSGPIKQPEVGEFVQWDMYSRQGVCLFDKPKCKAEINYSFKFEYNEGNIIFNCN